MGKTEMDGLLRIDWRVLRERSSGRVADANTESNGMEDRDVSYDCVVGTSAATDKGAVEVWFK